MFARYEGYSATARNIISVPIPNIANGISQISIEARVLSRAA
jgi:hypothetical protein